MCQFSIFLRVELLKGPYKFDVYNEAWLYTRLKGFYKGYRLGLQRFGFKVSEFGKLSGLEGQGVSGSKGV